MENRDVERGGEQFGTCNLAPARVFLIVAVVTFALEIRSVLAVNGWWLDEYFSLWSTDPSLTFIEAFTQRFKEPNPPLYYTALFWIRHLVADERAAVLLLNLTAIAIGLSAIWMASAKSKTIGWPLAAAAAFLCSGPTLRYVVEARTYMIALTTTFVASWLTALAIEVRDKRPGLMAYALAGAFSGLAHLYAALVCCCLATALVGLSLAHQRRDLMLPAIALGLSAGIVALGFLVWVKDLPPQTWIQFTYRSVVAAYSEFMQLALGSRTAATLFLALFGTSLFLRPTRPLAAAFGLAWALFVLIPLAASLKQPVIVGRYFLIAAPSLIVFVIFLMRALLAFQVKPPQSHLYTLAWLACLAYFCLADANGYVQARILTSEKSIWRGAGFVAAHATNCPPGSIHVYPGVIGEFAAASHASASLFVNAERADTNFLAIADSKCPVLGWAEHIFGVDANVGTENFVLNASAEELLRIVKIDASPSEVNIDRHWSGFVVIKR